MNMSFKPRFGTQIEKYLLHKFHEKKASRYARADNHRITWKPVTRAMMIVNIGARTDRHPLMAQAHGINA